MNARVVASDLEHLCHMALDLGAYRAAAIPATGVVLDPRVRMKCSIPLCENYGVNRMCPPNVISPEEFERALRAYRHAIVVQFDLHMNQEAIHRRFGEKGLGQLHKEEDYVKTLRAVQREMALALGKLEREALYKGYRFAAALAGGCCCLCEECVGPGGECRHPFEARPSIEAMGVDVVATAERAGLKVEFPAKERAVWTGLLLVD